MATKEKQQYNKKYYIKNRKKLSKYHKQRYATNREREIAKSKAYAKKNPDKILLRKYGLTLQEYDRGLAAQNFECAGCGVSFWDREPHVDHCHATGKVRGFLCGPCNRALGMVGDSPDTLRRLIAYIERATNATA